MKKFLLLMLTVALAFSLVACGQQEVADTTTQSDYEYVKANGKMLIGYTIYEPMNYMEDGELTGFDTEFAQAVCEKLGVQPEFVEINWDTKFVTLDSKKIDCIWNGMTISDEVRENCSVSKAYVKNAQVVVMNEEKIADYPDVESLKELTFTAEAGSAGEAAIKDNALDAKYLPVAAQTDALLAVIGGQADACVIDITMAETMTADGTSYEALGASLELTTEEYGIGFRKDSDLAEKVDAAIDELITEGVMAELATKYGLTLAF